MASVVLSSVGASLGNALLPGLGGIGGRVGSLLGRRVGAALDEDIGWSSDSDSEGARLENLRVQDSRYGLALPVVYGRVRIAGNVIWASELIETAHREKVGGGKGGGGSVASGSRTTYSYSVHCAVALAVSPSLGRVALGRVALGGIATIWADSKILYQNGAWVDGVVSSARFYWGDAEQETDPLMESLIGVGSVPAYRGVAYVVLEGLQLGHFGNRLPNLTFEVLPDASEASPSWVGDVYTDVPQGGASSRYGGLLPFVSADRRVFVGGRVVQNGVASFMARGFDVSDGAPRMVADCASAGFACAAVGDCAWKVQAKARVASMLLVEANGAESRIHVTLFDTVALRFGAVASFPFELSSEPMGIYWLDALRFVVPACENGRRGVLVFARSGLSVVRLGFFDVWGAGSASSMGVMAGAVVSSCSAGGIYLYATTGDYTDVSVFARRVVWGADGLSVGDALSLCAHVNFGDAEGQACFLPCDEGALTFFRSSRSGMRMMSFLPLADSLVVTRGFQVIVNQSFWQMMGASPVVCGGALFVLQRDSWSVSYRLSEIALGASSFVLSRDGVPVAGFESAAADFGVCLLDASKLFVCGASSGNVVHVGVARRFRTDVSMARIVGDVLARCGIAADSFDGEALADRAIEGYVLDRVMSGAAVLAALRVYAPFEIVETGAGVKAVLLGQNACATIPACDIVCEEGDKAEKRGAVRMEVSRDDAALLPSCVCLDYLESARNYEIGTQRAWRFDASGGGAGAFVARVSLPLVCSAQRARALAQDYVDRIWAERQRVVFSLSRRWLALQIGDGVKLETLGDMVWRVVRVRARDAVLEVEAVVVAGGSRDGLAADGGGQERVTQEAAGDSWLSVLDLPMLRDEDDRAGVYCAVSGESGWRGATLWMARDGGDYVRVGRADHAAVCGVCVSDVPLAQAFTWDRRSVVYVQLLSGHLESCSPEAVLNGAHVALIGDEIIQFQQAVLVDAGLYALRGLLRGRRGTVPVAHAAGERFLLLDEDALQFFALPYSSRGVATPLRAVTYGQNLDRGCDVLCVPSMRCLRPFAPVHGKAVRKNGDIVFSWVRRTRKLDAWVDYVDGALDQRAELYDVEVMDGARVVRLVEDWGGNSFVYSAAMQTLDWGASLPSSFTVRVYQKSDVYGRGDALVIII